MLPTNYDISSVQPTVAASEGTSVFGHQRDVRERSHTYQGVQKDNDKPIYIGQVRDNDATKRDRLIYLGKFDKDVNAARAHDLVTLKLWGSGAKTKFPESQYKRALESLTDMTKMDVVDTVRRDFCTGKWQASFGIGSDYRFLTIFDTEEEAARASDVESIRSRGHKAITNVSTKFYDIEAILNGETDEKVIYQLKGTADVEPMQAFEGKGTSTTMFYGTGNVNGERVQEFARPISGNTEEQANYVALASQDVNDTTGNVSLMFQHERTNA